MGLNELSATVNSVVPAQAEKVFDRWKLVRLLVRSPDDAAYMTARVNFRKGKKTESGWELAPNAPENEASISIADVYILADGDAELEAAINTIVDRLKSIGSERGVL